MAKTKKQKQASKPDRPDQCVKIIKTPEGTGAMYFRGKSSVVIDIQKANKLIKQHGLTRHGDVEEKGDQKIYTYV